MTAFSHLCFLRLAKCAFNNISGASWGRRHLSVFHRLTYLFDVVEYYYIGKISGVYWSANFDCQPEIASQTWNIYFL